MRRTLIALATAATFFSAGVAFAQTTASTTATASITFPIADLDNCASRDACKAYCEVTAHQSACLSFAESHGLMRKEDTDKARAVLSTIGPGGCKGTACKAYCADTSHQDECASFAAEHGLLRAAEVAIIQDIKQNGGPGGCKSPTECRAYCSDTTHMAECKAFAEAHGLNAHSGELMKNPNAAEHMGSSTVAKMADINAILAKTAGPGGCKTVDACRAYCAVTAHQVECVAFAQANGLSAHAGGHMGSSTEGRLPPMRRGTTTMMLPPGEHMGTTSKDKRGVVWPVDPVRPPLPPDGAKPAPETSLPGSGDTSTRTSGGAGVLWGILNFFGVHK